MRQMLWAVPLGIALVWIAALPGQEKKADPADARKPDPKKVQELMRRKLASSQQILEGLALNDLDKVSKNADELIRVRKEAAWKVLRTDQYELWSEEFQRSAESLVKAARDRNLESAKLNYLSMTLACFHCHTYVRDMRKTGL
jgi:hypothetical protein